MRKILNPNLVLQQVYFFNGINVIPLELSTSDSHDAKYSLMYFQGIGLIENIGFGYLGKTKIIEVLHYDLRVFEDNLGRKWVQDKHVGETKHLFICADFVCTEEMDIVMNAPVKKYRIRIVDDLNCSNIYLDRSQLTFKRFDGWSDFITERGGLF